MSVAFKPAQLNWYNPLVLLRLIGLLLWLMLVMVKWVLFGPLAKR